MKNCSTPKIQSARRIRPLAGATALAVAVTVSLPQAAAAGPITPPPVPANIEVPEGNRAFLVGHAVGTQNYVCLPAGAGFAWSLFTPQATLFDGHQRQVTTHFFGPNPVEKGAIRAAWQHSRDTSTVWGVAVASSSDPEFVAPGAVPWLLVRTVGVQDGPRSADSRRRGALTETTFIQRLTTSGGVAPATGCSVSTDVGSKAFMPYTADYFFYRAERDADDGN